MLNHAAAESAFRAEPALAPRLKVALFTGNYDYVMDGPVRALNKFVAHLESQGHQALIFAPTTNAPALKHAGELVVIPSVPLPGSRSEYRLGLGLPGAARKRLDAFAPTIVHIATPDWLGIAALNYAESHGIPAVASVHTRFDTYPRYYGVAWLEPYITKYLRWFYSRCARIYPPSESMVDQLARDRIGREVRLWPRGVDQMLFNPERRDLPWRRSLGVDDDATLAAWVGRLVLEKGLDVFAEALRAAQEENPKIRALIVGDGPERARFEELLPDGAFVGYLHGEDLSRAYASADIFFNPSVTETFGNVTLEAMASGLPCVCASASGSRSLIEPGETGVLVDSKDFARALLTLASDPTLRRGMGAKARAKSGTFRWDVILDRLIADFQEVVAAHADNAVNRAQMGAPLSRRPGIR